MEDNRYTRCWECPFKFSCALWLFDKWNVNWEICNCTDERLVALENPFEVDYDLLDKWSNQVTQEDERR